jgi:aryl-alcohol dehydrogenase-like predicted oxidoreductase
VRYHPLGGTGLLVSRVVLGAANFGESVDEATADTLVGAALDGGINTFDTADVYVGGRSEKILGKAIRHRRDQVVLCTKVGSRVGDSEADLRLTVDGVDRLDHDARWRAGIAPTDKGLSRKHLVDGLEASLRRLGTGYVDVYQLHRFDPHADIEEVLRTLDDLVRSGKVRYVGCSGWAAWQIYRSLWISDVRSMVRFHSLQLPYSIVERAPEKESLPACGAANIGVLAYRSLAGGLLSGRYSDGTTPVEHSRIGSRAGYRRQYLTPPMLAGAAAVADFGNEQGRSSIQTSIAWVLAQRGVAAALVGASSPAQLTEVIGAVENPLSAEEADALALKVSRSMEAASKAGTADD